MIISYTIYFNTFLDLFCSCNIRFKASKFKFIPFLYRYDDVSRIKGGLIVYCRPVIAAGTQRKASPGL